MVVAPCQQVPAVAQRGDELVGQLGGLDDCGLEQLLNGFGERRSDLTGVSVRPTWLQWEGNVERNVGPIARARGTDKSASF
ncbi:hypothetical protein [Actinoplanes sp. NPDC049316]|uniref:hypothetical protein n=1 Tax=Actinoplanes sp. NPDC049316 TaxID=3154727 RepID=UPI00342E2D19